MIAPAPVSENRSDSRDSQHNNRPTSNGHVAPARRLYSSASYRKILGINFFVGNAMQAVKAGMKGGLVVAPAAPSLLDLNRDRHYRDALLEADLAITDSGFMVLVWNAVAPDSICRVSGLEYLKLLLAEPDFRRAGATFWVMPSWESLERNLHWLRARGVCVEEEDCYIAPKYSNGNIQDEKLLEIINTRRPAHVVIAVGGGTQERLGLYLKRHCDFQPGIHCTGAAIAFLSGDQARIPDWADRHKLGWLFRCASDPSRFVPRYAKAFRLAVLLWRFRDQLPM
jgi:UDP-N-acetyl-D-mannosaminuronic acid transferase (WecB/TagA/CpsF family)